MRRALGLLLVVALGALGAACAPKKTTWKTVEPTDVPREARAAVAKGLVPVLYLDAPYTVASANLVAWKDKPEMRQALTGIAILMIEWDKAEAFETMRPGWFHSFHALDASGKPTGAILQPGTKNGPCADEDVEACANWIRPFARSLL